MTAGLLWNDILVYAAQITIVAVAAAAILALIRLRAPNPRLIYWQCAIGACLLLPLLRPWKTEIGDGAVVVSTVIISATPARQPSGFPLPSFATVMLALIVAGITTRLAWLSIGLWRLRTYRLRSKPFRMESIWEGQASKGEAELRISDDVASPVTFGYRRPVVLFPPRFAELDRQMREAILLHEILHVRRRDWLWTMAEETIRAMFWFHPAMWWMLGEAQLAREQSVDHEVISVTRARERYLDALLAIAGAPARLDIAPAPLFLKRRHLKQRVISIVKEVQMSKTRLISAFTAGGAMLAGVCWIVTGALPLSAAPQDVIDAPGVSVQAGAAPLIHRNPVIYPQEAIAKGVQGTVIVQAKLGPDGTVADAAIVSGPEELRKAALQSVLNWHFDRGAAGTTQQVTIEFALPQSSTSGTEPRPVAAVRFQGLVPPGLADQPAVIRSIDISGLSDQAAAELMASLPVHVEDTMTLADTAKITAAVRAFDAHLTVGIAPAQPSGVRVQIRPQTGNTAAVPEPNSHPIRVGGEVAQANLITKVTPVYPPLAKQAGVQGTVQLDATIGPDGTVQNLRVLSGPPLLVNAAVEAVKNWVYRPTLLNGNPTQIVTTVDINFTLSQ